MSAFVNLKEREPDTPWTLRDLMNQIHGSIPLPPPFPDVAAVVEKGAVEDALRRLASSITPRLAILLSPIDEAGEDVARDFLEILGALYDSGLPSRPGVVIGGSLDLVHLTHGDRSPFNMAETIFLEPATRQESAEALDDMARRVGFANLDDRFRDALLEWTDGQWDLLRMLLARHFWWRGCRDND